MLSLPDHTLHETKTIFLIPELHIVVSSKILFFFPSVIIEWNKLDPEVQTTPRVNIFKKNILKFMRPTANNIFSCNNLKGIRYLTRLRLGLNYPHEHKFQGTLNPLCACDCDVENACHFFLYFPKFPR